jgi:hypothetical protein
VNDPAGLCSGVFGARVGFGGSPALLVVDFAAAFASPDRASGADTGAEIARANRLIASAHPAGTPTFSPTIADGDVCSVVEIAACLDGPPSQLREISTMSRASTRFDEEMAA